MRIAGHTEEIGLEDLKKLVDENARNPRWAKVVGFYKKLSGIISTDEQIRTINSLNKALMNKGYTLNKEAVIELMKK